MPVHDWAQFALSVTFVFLLLAACLWWLAKRKGGFLVNRVNRPIQIEDTLQLGIKHRLMLVKVDDYKVLVCVTPNEMQTLHAWRYTGQSHPSNLTGSGAVSNVSTAQSAPFEDAGLRDSNRGPLDHLPGLAPGAETRRGDGVGAVGANVATRKKSFKESLGDVNAQA